MVFVLSVMLLAAWALEPTPLPAGQPAAIAVEQAAPVALAAPAPALATQRVATATLQSDAFWLGVILALILALASVYVRWAVFEYA
jgi:hypothetical protein